MAICSSRSETIKTVKNSGSRTGLVSLINDGDQTLESSAPSPLLNNAAQFLGRSLNATGDRTAAREVVLAPNDRFNKVVG